MIHFSQSAACSVFSQALHEELAITTRKGTKIQIAQCANCRVSHSPKDTECLFAGFRNVLWDETNQKSSLQFKESDAVERMDTRMVYSEKHSAAAIIVKKSVAKQYLLPVVETEIAAYRDTEVVFRRMDVSIRTLCDRCSTSIFSESHFCAQCGKEYCPVCFASSTSTRKVFCHVQGRFLRLTRFLPSELEELKTEMESIPDWHHPSDSAVVSRHLRPLRREQLHEAKFNALWRLRKPILVTGLSKDFQTPWTPEYFIKRYGATQCEVEDCETGQTHASTVAAFFSLFDRADVVPRRILKLKDWPPTVSFKSMFPELHDDFERVIPLPEYTTSSGAKNLAAHFPLNSVAPDLGPKMYNALASVCDDSHSGSTRLHLDASDAINLLTYASKQLDGSAGFALWHIFAPEDSNAIRKYLTEKAKTRGPRRSGDPIHNRDTYLMPGMLQELREKFCVYPYVIKQYLGDAVFIPAGCAHQVSNQTDCMKVACDFISPESVVVCKRLSEEFRQQRLARKWAPDVIPFTHMLYYTWVSVAAISQDLPACAQDSETMAKRQTPVNAGLYYCPLCLLPGAHRATPNTGARRFACAGGAIDHVIDVHGLQWDRFERRHCRTLDPLPLARRICRAAAK